MLKGKIRMGTNMENLRRWENDNLNECSPEDRVWGFGIRSSEVLHGDHAKIEDEVLVKMLYEGILDKKEGAPAWTEMSTVKHGVRFMSNMVLRVVQRCIRTDAKVRHSGCLLLTMADRHDV